LPGRTDPHFLGSRSSAWEPPGLDRASGPAPRDAGASAPARTPERGSQRRPPLTSGYASLARPTRWVGKTAAAASRSAPCRPQPEAASAVQAPVR
jgi:hypothetical protein